LLSDKDPPKEEKDEDEGYEECGAYRAVTKILQWRRMMRMRGTKNVTLTVQ
jgi:hypothetical protein